MHIKYITCIYILGCWSTVAMHQKTRGPVKDYQDPLKYTLFLKIFSTAKDLRIEPQILIYLIALLFLSNF